MHGTRVVSLLAALTGVLEADAYGIAAREAMRTDSQVQMRRQRT